MSIYLRFLIAYQIILPASENEEATCFLNPLFREKLYFFLPIQTNYKFPYLFEFLGLSLSFWEGSFWSFQSWPYWSKICNCRLGQGRWGWGKMTICFIFPGCGKFVSVFLWTHWKIVSYLNFGMKMIQKFSSSFNF